MLVVERWILAQPGIDREQFGEHLHAWLQVAVADGGVLCVAVMNSTLRSGRSACAASAIWRPFIPPGKSDSVTRRSIRLSD